MLPLAAIATSTSAPYLQTAAAEVAPSAVGSVAASPVTSAMSCLLSSSHSEVIGFPSAFTGAVGGAGRLGPDAVDPGSDPHPAARTPVATTSARRRPHRTLICPLPISACVDGAESSH